MKIAFDVLISKLDSAQKRIIEFEDRSEENSQAKIKYNECFFFFKCQDIKDLWTVSKSM